MNLLLLPTIANILCSLYLIYQMFYYMGVSYIRLLAMLRGGEGFSRGELSFLWMARKPLRDELKLGTVVEGDDGRYRGVCEVNAIEAYKLIDEATWAATPEAVKVLVRSIIR